MNTVFYSWQSDLPNNTNRRFIRDCIDRSIRAVQADLGLEDALRPLEGIKGETGNVDVANTIFERIDSCSIFVPDISIVTEPDARRPMPNANVMIEYGRATKSCADRLVIPIFNAAFGDWETDRPFDMKHKSPPIIYSLHEEHDRDQKESARNSLVKSLTKELRTILEAGYLEKNPNTEDQSFQPISPYAGHNANNFPTALLGRIRVPNSGRDEDTNVWLRKGPQLYLRLIPSSNENNLNPLDLCDLLGTHNVRDLLGYKTSRIGGFYYRRNRDGASVFTTESAEITDKDVFAFGVTQIYPTGELWGVDTWLLDPERTKSRLKVSYPVISAFTLEEGLITSLSQYLRFARDALQLTLPLRWVAGIREIEQHRLGVDDQHFGGSFNREIHDFGVVENYEDRIHRILEPFFNKVWMEFGERRPATASDKWEDASGFDL